MVADRARAVKFKVKAEKCEVALVTWKCMYQMESGVSRGGKVHWLTGEDAVLY